MIHQLLLHFLLLSFMTKDTNCPSLNLRNQARLLMEALQSHPILISTENSNALGKQTQISSALMTSTCGHCSELHLSVPMVDSVMDFGSSRSAIVLGLATVVTLTRWSSISILRKEHSFRPMPNVDFTGVRYYWMTFLNFSQDSSRQSPSCLILSMKTNLMRFTTSFKNMERILSARFIQEQKLANSLKSPIRRLALFATI